MNTLERTRRHQAVDRRIGILMAFVAATLAVAAFVHLAGYTPAGSKPPFEAHHAGVAEVIIGVVLAYGPRARAAALATTSFAILGFLVGLTITARGGDLPDLLYHVTMLPVLVGLILLARTGKTNVDTERITPLRGQGCPHLLERGEGLHRGAFAAAQPLRLGGARHGGGRRSPRDLDAGGGDLCRLARPVRNRLRRLQAPRLRSAAPV